MIDDKVKRNLLMKQILLFFLIISINLVILVLTLPNPSKLIADQFMYKDDDENPYHTAACDLGEYSWVQIVYCIILLVFSFIQALRGHGRLPDAFNEGNAIIVSSSTSVCFLLFLWIYGSTLSSINTNEFFSVISIVVSIDLIILLVCFYAGRVYIMFLDPKRNTKAFVRAYTRKRGFLLGKAITS